MTNPIYDLYSPSQHGRTLDENEDLRAENERWRAAWARWRPGIENTRDFYEKDGNEARAKAYAAILRDFDAAGSHD